MVEYILDENGFRAYETAPAGMASFRNYGELSRLGKDWTGKALVEYYNALAAGQGKTTVTRFMHRDAGLKRLWGLIQELPVQPTTPPFAPVPERATKKDLVLRLVQEERGATLEELMSATGWQAHSVRGFLSVQRKEYDIERIKRPDDITAYHAWKKADGS